MWVFDNGLQIRLNFDQNPKPTAHSNHSMHCYMNTNIVFLPFADTKRYSPVYLHTEHIINLTHNPGQSCTRVLLILCCFLCCFCCCKTCTFLFVKITWFCQILLRMSNSHCARCASCGDLAF